MFRGFTVFADLPHDFPALLVENENSRSLEIMK